MKGEVDADAECNRVFKQLAADENDSMLDERMIEDITAIRAKTLNVLGRTVVVDKCCGYVADIDFDQVHLCISFNTIYRYVANHVVQSTISYLPGCFTQSSSGMCRL